MARKEFVKGEVTGQLFVKVRSKETKYPFYLDDELAEKFFLYWSPEPMQVLEAIGRTPEEDLILDYLVECFASRKLLSIPDLLKFEDDRDSLSRYIGGRVPNLSSSRMRMFLEQKRGEKDGSGKTILPETAQSSSHAMKRWF
ncbi:uncharacterized protein LOC127745605 [Arachis duranensis]|uniref:Uncharacterized protein LOC127745605 n=1 Tax=Arachis duranensis TaxID=130453 RepID=A0A9C6TPL0_ARADU|nr:uncharacterized protein LOC127745605 [Arachis duranensis]